MWVCASDHAPHDTLEVAYQDSWRLSAYSERRRCPQGLRQRSEPRSGRWCRCACCCRGGSRPGPAGRLARPARPACPACCLRLRRLQARQLRPLLLLQAAHEQQMSETTHHLSGRRLSGCSWGEPGMVAQTSDCAASLQVLPCCSLRAQQYVRSGKQCKGAL